MMMRVTSQILFALSALVMAGGLVGCASGPKHEKVFAQGDGFDPLAFDRFQEDARAVAEANTPRQITIPANKEEDRGLRVDMLVNGVSIRALTAEGTATLKPIEIPAGNPVYVTLTVRNTTLNAITVPYPTEKRFDVVVYTDSEQRNPVHVHSDTQSYAQLFQEVVLGPGANLKRVIELPTTATDLYDGKNARDLTRPLIPGEYFVFGTHEGTPFLATSPARIQITE